MLIVLDGPSRKSGKNVQNRLITVNQVTQKKPVQLLSLDTVSPCA